MSDLYDIMNGKSVGDIKDQNTFPDTQPPEKQRPSNPEGMPIPETVDYFQLHPQASEFNEPNGVLSIYDPGNPDRQLMDLIETEVITLTSPPSKYYKLRKDRSTIDDLYGESRRRDAYDPPVILYGSYEDPSPEQELTQYGLQQMEEIEIWFNYNYLLHTIGDRIHIGDIIMTYDTKLWEIMTSVIIDETAWRAQHNKVVAKKLNTEGIYLPDTPDITRSPNRNAKLK